MEKEYVIHMTPKSLLSLCESELSSVHISINDNKIVYIPKIIDKEFIANYFLNNKEKLDRPGSQVFDVFSDTIDFLDQLSFENLLIDTEQERVGLLSRIEELKKQLK